MEARIVNRIYSQYLSPVLPGFRIKQHLIYRKDFEYLLLGFHFESSAFSSSSFTVYAFVQPLFLPLEAISLNFGERLGALARRKDTWWEYDENREAEIAAELRSMIQGVGLSILEGQHTVEKFIRRYRNVMVDMNKHHMEAVGYAYLLADQYRHSRFLLYWLDKILSREIAAAPDIGWLRDQQARVRQVSGFLRAKDYEGGKQLLVEWRNYSVENLKLIAGES